MEDRDAALSRLPLPFRLKRAVRFGPSARERRLEGDLREFEGELAGTDPAPATPASPGTDHRAWRQQAEVLLGQARDSLRRGDVETGNVLLAAAKRRAIFGLDEDQLKATAIALRYEAAKKLAGSWRGGTIVKLLERLDASDGCRERLLAASRDTRLTSELSVVLRKIDAADPDVAGRTAGAGAAASAGPTTATTAPSPSLGRGERSSTAVADVLAVLAIDLGKAHTLIHEATRLRDQFSNNEYHKVGVQRRSLSVLGALVVLLMLLLFGLAALDVLPDRFGPGRLGGVAVLGALGGALSAVRSVSRPVGRLRIPEQVAEGWIILVRPLFGAAAALALYAFLQGRLLTVGVDSDAAILAISFAAGFTERILVSAVASVAPDTERESPAQGSPSPKPVS